MNGMITKRIPARSQNVPCRPKKGNLYQPSIYYYMKNKTDIREYSRTHQVVDPSSHKGGKVTDLVLNLVKPDWAYLELFPRKEIVLT